MSRIPQRWRLRIESALILALLWTMLLLATPGIEFHPDESQRIYASRNLEVFVEGRFDSAVFGPSFFTRTVMPLPQYLIGIGRRAAGFSPEDLTPPWSFQRTHEQNRVRGAIPSDELLRASRAPMALLAGVSGLLVFTLTRRMGGRPAAYVALGLFALNPFLARTLCRAMAEGALVASVLAAIWVGARTVEGWLDRDGVASETRRRLTAPLLGCIALGVLGGLAGASKLNGASAVAGGALLILMVPLVDDGRLNASRSRFALAAATASFAAGLVTFFGLNPYFYRELPRRVSELIPALLNSLESLRAEGAEGLIEPADRLGVLAERIFETHAGISFEYAALLNALLCAVGVGVVLRGSREWLRGRRDTPGAATCTSFAVLALFTALPTLTTPIDWERYYVLPVIFTTVCIALGAEALGARALARGRSASAHRGEAAGASVASGE